MSTRGLKKNNLDADAFNISKTFASDNLKFLNKKYMEYGNQAQGRIREGSGAMG